jgi:hypothetical protein
MIKPEQKSKFDEICLTYRQSRRGLLEYQDVCQGFAKDLVYGMIDYFDWPHNQEITYIPLGEDVDPNNRFYAISAAMQMDDDSFWHFGLELTVQEPGGSYPLPFLMSFFIKKVGPHFIVKLGPEGKEIKIHEQRRGELTPFFDAVFVQVMTFFTRDYQDAVTKGLENPGFIVLPPEADLK